MWEISLSWQIQVFLCSVFLGVIFCFAFDFLSITETKLRISKTAIYLTDILFFTALGFINFCFFLAGCNGEIRGYVFIGELIGFFLCKKTLAVIYVPLFLLLFRAVRKYIIRPVSFVFQKIHIKAFKIGRKTLFFIKKGLKKPKWLVYTKEKCPKKKRKDE